MTDQEARVRQKLSHLLLEPAALEPFLHSCQQSLEGLLQDAWQGLAPLVTVLARDLSGANEILVFQVQSEWTTTQDKQCTLRGIGQEVHRRRLFPVAFSIATEAWLSDKQGMRPADDPQRREALVLAGGLLGQAGRGMTTMKFLRAADNRILPGVWDTLSTEGVETPLLDELLVGFFGLCAVEDN